MNDFQYNRIFTETFNQKRKIEELEKELAEVKKYNLTQMDAQADSYMEGMTNNLTLLESIGDIYMQLLDLQDKIEELTNEKVDK